MIEGQRPWQGGAERDESDAWERAGYGEPPARPHIVYEESRLNREMPRPRQTIERELTLDDSIRWMFFRFDLLENNNKPLRPNLRLGGETPKDFLSMKQTRYYKSIDGESKSIDCSILDRERGYISGPGDLPDELSYPELCVLTFYDLPGIENPAMPTTTKNGVIYHSEYTNSELAKINKLVNEEYGDTYPKSAKTIKMYRDQSKNRPGVVLYCHTEYEGTPISKLLEAHPMPGREALNSLFNYFMMFFFDHYTLQENAPTRKNIIESFMCGPRPEGTCFPKEDLAEKQFDLLVEYGIITGLKGYTNGKHLLY